MTELLSEFFVKVFGTNVELATVLIAMIPIIELRGAIPFATNSMFWQTNTLNNWQALGWSLLGSSVIVPIIAIIFLPIIHWLKKTKLFRKLALSIESKVNSHANSIVEKNAHKNKNLTWIKVLGVFVFVAIPLPLTGVWTGTCVAVVLGLGYLTTCATVILGNVCAGLIISLILEFFPWLNDYLFFIFIVIVLIFILYCFVAGKIKKHKAKQLAETQASEDNITKENEEINK